MMLTPEAPARRRPRSLALAATGLPLLLLASLLIANIGPYKYVVLTGKSMEPTYFAGDLLVVHEKAPHSLSSGDPVTYRTDVGLVTHRVTKVVLIEEKAYVQTKGDANSVIDPGLRAPETVVGEPVMRLPLMGFVADAFFGVLLVPFLFLLLLALVLNEARPVLGRLGAGFKGSRGARRA